MLICFKWRGQVWRDALISRPVLVAAGPALAAVVAAAARQRGRL